MDDRAQNLESLHGAFNAGDIDALLGGGTGV
jgi:hypothetical protein